MKSSSKWLWRSMEVEWICLSLLTGSQQQMKLSVVTYLDRWSHYSFSLTPAFVQCERYNLISINLLHVCLRTHFKNATNARHRQLSFTNCVSPTLLCHLLFHCTSPCLPSPPDLHVRVPVGVHQITALQTFNANQELVSWKSPLILVMYALTCCKTSLNYKLNYNG